MGSMPSKRISDCNICRCKSRFHHLCIVAIVTFTTDFGSDNPDVALLKGAILKEVPDVQLIDITHGVRKFDISEAAFHIKKALPHFPIGSTHIVGVRSAASETSPHRAASFAKQHVIAADTGIFSLIGQPEALVNLDAPAAERFWPTFPELASFVPAAVRLARGNGLNHLGQPASSCVEAKSMQPRIDDASIIGEVIFVDGYGNAVTNISRADFHAAVGGRPITIRLRSTRMEIKRIHTTYADVPVGERVAVFNHMDLLEIAMNNHQVPGGHGGADSLLGLQRGTAIRISIGEEAPAPDFFAFS